MFNEFIVWDELSKMFWEQKDIITMSGKIIKLYDEEWFLVNDKDLSTHNYIGKTDINDKKIYADCSIVEFLHSKLKKKFKGVFFYNDKSLEYEIRLIEEGYYIEYFPKTQKEFKIIDTIQENKLGLIK